MEVAIVKYDAGNMFSVVNALRRLGVEPVQTNDKEVLMRADRILFPGQGHARTAMDSIRKHNLDSLIKELRQPVLGICIGQQLLCRHSEEGDTYCIGIFDADVKRFAPERHEDKVPAMGWNAIDNLGSEIFRDFKGGEYVYFVHSYYVPPCEWTVATSDYILPYSAALHKDNFYTTQFHPEKSGDVGERILRNFLDIKA